MEKLILPSLLSINETAFMATRLLELTTSLTESDDKLKTLRDALSGIVERLMNNLKYSGKSLLTPKISVFDKNRDKAFICLRDQLHGLSLSLIEEKAAPAAELYSIIDKLGVSLHRMGYKAESALLQSLFKAYDKQAAQQDLTDLGLLPYYESLKTANKAFEEASEQRIDEQTTRATENEAASDVVEEMIPAMTNLTAYMQLYSELEPGTYGDIYNQMVTVITNINTTARARKTRSESEKTEETEV